MDDLRDHLEAAIGTGPQQRPVEPLIAAGRRAVRRRRIAAVAGTAAVLAVVGSTYALAGGQPDAARDPQVTHSGPTRSAEPSPDDPGATLTWGSGEYVRWLPSSGVLQVRPGVEVLDRVDDYLKGSPAYQGSVAMDVLFRGKESWVTLEWNEGTSGYGLTEPSDGWADFRAWVADQAAANGVGGPGGTGYPDLVFVRADGTLDPLGHAEILAQTTADLPAGFDRAAYVDLEGHRYLVLSRGVAGQSDLVTIHAEPHGDTLGELLAYARQKFADGEGVR